MSKTTTTTRTILNTMAGITITVLSLSPTARAEEANVESTSTASFAALPESPASATPLLPVAPMRLVTGSAASTDHRRDLRRWKLSLVPLAASQALDLSSSWGMRELNPVLAGPDGRFGVQAATVKLGVVGALVGIEYLIVKKYPRTARAFEKINWSGAALTSSFAVHNFMIR
jgi:hypothetical protein